jgi:hypothetical protein
MKLQLFFSKNTYFKNTEIVIMFNLGGNPQLSYPFINEILIYKR